MVEIRAGGAVWGLCRRGSWGVGRGRTGGSGGGSCYAFGDFLNLWCWPFTVGSNTSVSFERGAPVFANLHRFLVFSLTTSAIGWDTGRAVTNVIAIIALGPIVLVTLRRAARRANFGAIATFS